MSHTFTRHPSSAALCNPLRLTGERLLDATVAAALGGVICVAPWFMGGRHPLGETVLVALAVTAAGALIARHLLGPSGLAWTRTKAEFIFMGCIALVVLQWIPLSPGAIDLLSPRLKQTLPLWSAAAQHDAHLGQWSQLSLTPQDTQAALIMLLAYALIFIVALQLLRSVEDIERLLRLVALSTVALAAVGLLQYLFGNGKFLWIYQHPFRDTADVVKGPLINRNHFAHLMALGLAPVIWYLLQATNLAAPRGHSAMDKRGTQRDGALLLRAFGLGVVLLAWLMTLSRGGVAVGCLAMAVCVGAYYRRGLLSLRFVLLSGSVVLLIGAALAIHGYQQVSSRLSDYASGSLDKLDYNQGRRKIWQADIQGAREFVRVGTGIGSHREVHPMYYSYPSDVEFTHAENGYVQVALEAGVAGLLLLSLAITTCIAWCVQALRKSRDPRVYACGAAIAGSLVASAAHSVADFVWYIPACMSLTLLLAAAVCRLAHLTHGVEHAVVARSAAAKSIHLAAAVVLLSAGPWMIGNRFCAAMAQRHWDQYLFSSHAENAQTSKQRLDPALVEHLENVLYWTPGNARAHLRLAALCLQAFDDQQRSTANAMPLSQVRDAAIASQFGSRSALNAWLERAVGAHRVYLEKALWHARRGLAICPLRGEGYIYLAELCFLEGARADLKKALVDQAIQVRPHNSKVLLAAGNEAALAGDGQRMLEYWRRAFQGGHEDQVQLLDLLVTHRIPLEFVLQAFTPDLPRLRLIQSKYAAIARPEEMRTLLLAYPKIAQAELQRASEHEVAWILLDLSIVYATLNQPQPSVECVRRAVTSLPNDFEVRQAAARCLMQQKQFAEAEQHIRWCLQRRPGEEPLKAMHAEAVKGRLSANVAAPERFVR